MKKTRKREYTAVFTAQASTTLDAETDQKINILVAEGGPNCRRAFVLRDLMLEAIRAREEKKRKLEQQVEQRTMESEG